MVLNRVDNEQAAKTVQTPSVTSITVRGCAVNPITYVACFDKWGGQHLESKAGIYTYTCKCTLRKNEDTAGGQVR
jgi:hypothetical protein